LLLSEKCHDKRHSTKPTKQNLTNDKENQKAGDEETALEEKMRKGEALGKR